MNMLRTRVIPVLLLNNESLVKTVKFRNFTYVGDPCNTVTIFNEIEVDELIFLDIAAGKLETGPNFKLLRGIADECFMPLCYGGGIRTLDDAKAVMDIGFEKIIVNSTAFEKPELILEISNYFGSQAVIVSIDIKANIFGRKTVRTKSGKFNTGLDPVKWAEEVVKLGAGELFITSIDREGTWSGFDLDIIEKISNKVSVPVIAHGGGGSIDHIKDAVKDAGASAAALGSMVIFQKKGMGVLVNFPSQEILNEILSL